MGSYFICQVECAFFSPVRQPTKTNIIILKLGIPNVTWHLCVSNKTLLLVKMTNYFLKPCFTIASPFFSPSKTRVYGQLSSETCSMTGAGLEAARVWKEGRKKSKRRKGCPGIASSQSCMLVHTSLHRTNKGLVSTTPFAPRLTFFLKICLQWGIVSGELVLS